MKRAKKNRKKKNKEKSPFMKAAIPSPNGKVFLAITPEQRDRIAVLMLRLFFERSKRNNEPRTIAMLKKVDGLCEEILAQTRHLIGVANAKKPKHKNTTTQNPPKPDVDGK